MFSVDSVRCIENSLIIYKIFFSQVLPVPSAHNHVRFVNSTIRCAFVKFPSTATQRWFQTLLRLLKSLKMLVKSSKFSKELEVEDSAPQVSTSHPLPQGSRLAESQKPTRKRSCIRLSATDSKDQKGRNVGHALFCNGLVVVEISVSSISSFDLSWLI